MAKLTVDDLSIKSLSTNGGSSGKKLSTIGNTLVELDNLSGIHTDTQRLEGENHFDYFGFSLSLSADGSYLAIGAMGFDHGGLSWYVFGKVYIYKNSGCTWVLQQQIIGEVIFGLFGSSVNLSADGSYLAVGATGSNTGRGATYIYKRSDSSWVLQTRVDGENNGDQFGHSVSLSADGSYLAVGATRFDGDGGDDKGATYIYKRSDSTWGLQRQLVGENNGDQFGYSVSLSADGSYLAVGATGFDGDGG